VPWAACLPLPLAIIVRVSFLSRSAHNSLAEFARGNSPAGAQANTLGTLGQIVKDRFAPSFQAHFLQASSLLKPDT